MYSAKKWRFFRAGEMAQRIKMLASKPDDFSSIPGKHVTREPTPHGLHTRSMAHLSPQTYTYAHKSTMKQKN